MSASEASFLEVRWQDKCYSSSYLTHHFLPSSIIVYGPIVVATENQVEETVFKWTGYYLHVVL